MKKGHEVFCNILAGLHVSIKSGNSDIVKAAPINDIIAELIINREKNGEYIDSVPFDNTFTKK